MKDGEGAMSLKRKYASGIQIPAPPPMSRGMVWLPCCEKAGMAWDGSTRLVVIETGERVRARLECVSRTKLSAFGIVVCPEHVVALL